MALSWKPPFTVHYLPNLVGSVCAFVWCGKVARSPHSGGEAVTRHSNQVRYLQATATLGTVPKCP